MNKDTHKGISGIEYNSLNLPRSIAIDNPQDKGRISYTYSAGGVKLRTVHENDMNVQTAAVMSSAPFSSSTTHTTTTDYVGNMVYEDGTLKRILVDGGYIENNTYYFHITDHLGNNRVALRANGTIIQRSHYYPFGMSYAEGTGQDSQPYKYNGKELDRRLGLNMYDYSARYYEPAIGRFTTVDPLAEKYYSISPYAYVANNPLKYIDPTGMSYKYNWDTGKYEDNNGKEVDWEEVYDHLLRDNGIDDIVINGANNSSITIKTDAIDLSFNSEIDFKGKHSLDARNIAIGYEKYGKLNGVFLGGLYAQVPKQSVLFLGNKYGGYWYDYIGLEAGVAVETGVNGSVSGGRSWFIAYNNNPSQNNPYGFAGEYVSAGGTVGIKALAGISIDGGLSHSLDGSWSVWSIGASASAGLSFGMFAGGHGGGSIGVGTLKLVTPNVRETRKRSSASIFSNWLYHLPLPFLR